MKSKIPSLLAACLLTLASAYGEIVYDNGGPNQAAGNETTHWIQAENFQLNSPASIGSAEFWTLEWPGATWNGSIEWWIFNDAGGSPGAVVDTGFGSAITKIATGLTPMGYNEFVYNFALDTVVLAANTTYWFGIHLGGDYDRHEIYWETTASNSPNGHESEWGTQNNWYNNGQEHAFNLSAGTSSVPDAASTSMLLGVTLLGLVGISRRRHA